MADTETQEVKAFRSKTYSVVNYVPSVDLGAFNLTVTPKDNRIDVVIRVYLAQQQGGQLQLQKFSTQFAKLVPEVWNDKVRFVRRAKGWEKLVLKPRFKVEIVGLDSAHFRIEIQDEDDVAHAQGPFAMVTEKQYTGGGTSPTFAPRQATFGAASNNQGEIGSYRRNIIYDLSKSPLVIPVKVSPAQDNVARLRLEKFAREIMQLKVPRKFKSSRRPTLTVNGCGPGNRKTIAESVAAFLKERGIKNPMTVLASGDTKRLDGVELAFDMIELKTLFPEKPGSTKSLFRQITVAHEFGHMLGLPDEYLCMHALTTDAMENVFAMTGPEISTFKGSGMQIADVKQLPNGTIQVPHIVRHQTGFISLCHRAGVIPPEFGRMTPSLMSNGMILHPHHFVTLWEAICAATGLDDWQIEVS